MKFSIVSPTVLWCSSLEKNAYDHVTATYYLLAERLLRKQGMHRQHPPSPATPDTNKKPHLQPLALSPR
jgi:hypothetical protein